jgi:WD40 repeat protein
VSGSHDGTLRLWEVESGAARTLEGRGGWVTAVAFSPNGRHIVSGSEDRTLRLWELESGRQIARRDTGVGFLCRGARHALPDSQTTPSLRSANTRATATAP